MDTETVLQIIKMLDTRIYVLFMETGEETLEHNENRIFVAKLKILEDFKNHLQEYIELQVNQAENALGE
jgi:hypothetical protein